MEYLIIGAYAMAFYGVPRAPHDFDLYVHPMQENAAKIIKALDEFGFQGLDPEDLCRPGRIIMMGRPPMRIDLLTRISGVTWEAAWENKQAGTYGQNMVRLTDHGIIIDRKPDLPRKER